MGEDELELFTGWLVPTDVLFVLEAVLLTVVFFAGLFLLFNVAVAALGADIPFERDFERLL